MISILRIRWFLVFEIRWGHVCHHFKAPPQPLAFPQLYLWISFWNISRTSVKFWWIWYNFKNGLSLFFCFLLDFFRNKRLILMNLVQFLKWNFPFFVSFWNFSGTSVKIWWICYDLKNGPNSCITNWQNHSLFDFTYLI